MQNKVPLPSVFLFYSESGVTTSWRHILSGDAFVRFLFYSETSVLPSCPAPFLVSLPSLFLQRLTAVPVCVCVSAHLSPCPCVLCHVLWCLLTLCDVATSSSRFVFWCSLSFCCSLLWLFEACWFNVFGFECFFVAKITAGLISLTLTPYVLHICWFSN